jgi:hypothetical protein
MAAGAVFPPIVVFFDGAEYWLANSFQQIIAAKGWSYHRSALGKAVKRYLDQSSSQAAPASHVDENPAPPAATD